MNSRPVVCEPLEGRQLLAADLVASALAGRFPGTWSLGPRIPGLTVRLNNAGDQDVRENVVVRLLASADGVPDGGDPVLAEQTNRLRINAGRGRRLPIKFRQVPANVPPGDLPDHCRRGRDGRRRRGQRGEQLRGLQRQRGDRAVVREPDRGKPHRGRALAAGRPTRMTLTVLNGGNTNAPAGRS